MQERIRQTATKDTTDFAGDFAGARPSNDNQRAPLAMGRSPFPQDAVACIHKPCRSAMTSGKARTKGWRVSFERRSPPVIDPLMGWTGGDDTLDQVELGFPTLEAAIRYAERQGLRYIVQGRDAPEVQAQRRKRSVHAFSEARLQQLGLGRLEDSYARAIEGAAARGDPPGPEGWASPMDVVRDPALPLDAKRSILINWAWTEYLIDQATNEGMPENGRPSRLDEVGQALLALERPAANDRAPELSGSASGAAAAVPRAGRRPIDPATNRTRRMNDAEVAV